MVSYTDRFLFVRAVAISLASLICSVLCEITNSYLLRDVMIRMSVEEIVFGYICLLDVGFVIFETIDHV